MPNYLYNGIELPRPSNWDKEKYPYAMLSLFENEYHKGYIFDTSASKYTAFPVGEGDAGNSLHITVPTIIYSLEDNDGNITTSINGKWIITNDLSDETTARFRNGKYYSIVWSNYDVTGEDGTVYFYGSDPILVPPPIIKLYHKTNNQLNPITLYRKESGSNKKLTLYRGE